MKKTGMLRLVTLLMLGSSLLMFLIHCEKDPVKGWTFYLEEPPPPEIDSLSAVIKNCVPPYPVTFKAAIKNAIGTMTYSWDFGDGNISHDQIPTHIYSTKGVYNVRLTVTNKIGTDTASLAMPELNSASIPVKAAFSYSHFNNNNFAPAKVIFSNRSSGANLAYWYFGDGAESNNYETEHIFNTSGNYNVRLRGTCTNGSYNEVTQQVYISPAPQRVYIDSLTLMLPSGYKRNDIYIEVYHNTTYIGSTRVFTPSSYPIKLKRPLDIPNTCFFDYVQFTSNEVFKFLVYDYVTDAPPVFLYEILLSSVDIKNNFYPRAYYDIRTVPSLKDVFIDLYLSY